MSTLSKPAPRRYSTTEVARLTCRQSHTISTTVSRKGSFLGLKPVAKLPNGRLLWDADEVDCLIGAKGELQA